MLRLLDFPGVAGLERDLAKPGNPSCRARADAISRQVLGFSLSELAPKRPGCDAEDWEWNVYHEAFDRWDGLFLTDRLEASELVGRFMGWGIDVTDGRGNSLQCLSYFSRQLEAIALGMVPCSLTPTVRSWKLKRVKVERTNHRSVG